LAVLKRGMSCLPQKPRSTSPLELHAATVQANAEESNSSAFRCLASFPMYTVPLPTLLHMTAARVQAFEELLEAGVLVDFDESMGKAIFVSHQWLSTHHPDPDGQQLKVLQDALKNLLADRSRISTSVVTEIFYGQSPTPSAKDLRTTPLFLWYDYFSCPQNSQADQLRAINSIPSYVARCLYFMILSPALKHESRSEILSQWTWAQRGWCRAERMARELAPSSGFVIIVESATYQTLLPEFQSFLYSPGEGRFTVTEDSHKVASIVVQLIWNKLLLCLREGDLHNYRFILNQQATRLRNLNIDPVDLAIPGFNPSQDPFVNPEAFALARFMHQNGFEAVTQIDEAGWSPLCYAAMNGSSAVVSELLRRRADANECTQKGTKEAQFPKKMTALSLSACFRSNEVMQVLLSARAAVNVRDGRRQTALHWACISNNAEGVRILVKAGANAEMLAITGQSAFQLACSAGALEAISEMLLQFPKQDLQYSLHFAFLLGGGSGHLVRTLFEAKADVNERLELLQTKYLLLWTLCKAASFSHRVGASTRLRELAFHHRRATPLMFSVICGAFEATYALLAVGARRDLRNSRRRTAVDLAVEICAPPALVAKLNPVQELAAVDEEFAAVDEEPDDEMISVYIS